MAIAVHRPLITESALALLEAHYSPLSNSIFLLPVILGYCT
jgi:hypothetical protein